MNIEEFIEYEHKRECMIKRLFLAWGLALFSLGFVIGGVIS